MKITLSTGRIVVIRWEHKRRKGLAYVPAMHLENGKRVEMLDAEGNVLYRKQLVSKTKGGKTLCHIELFDKDGAEIQAVGVGEIKVNRKDNYTKAVGRKEALRLALEQMNTVISKEERTSYIYPALRKAMIL